jgi:hypothetical protein
MQEDGRCGGSDNPDAESFDATSAAIPIARLVETDFRAARSIES